MVKHNKKIPGIYFSYNKTEAFNLNYDEQLENLEKTLNLLKMHGLFSIGRIVIVKSLGISKYIYTAAVTEINYIIKIGNMIYNFISRA